MAASESPLEKAVPVPEWLILGAFPLQQREEGRWLENGYEAEADFAPTPDEPFRGRTWTAWKATSDSGAIDFFWPGRGFEGMQWCYAYAACYVYSPAAQKVRLLIGSDDGYIVYLNGREMARVDTHRVLIPDQDVVPVRLEKGWNLLMLKISQALGAWGFQVRIAGARTAEPTHRLRFRLERPARAGFRGLGRRARGTRIESMSLRPSLRRGELGLNARVEVFNDHSSTGRGVRTVIEDASGNVVSEGVIEEMPPFAVDASSLWLAISRIRPSLVDPERNPLTVAVSSNGTEDRQPLPLGATTEAFVGILGGYEIPVKGAGRRVLRIPVPKALRGTPMLIRVEPREPSRLAREVSHPELPERLLGPRETKASSVEVEFDIPVAAGDVTARVWFGDEGQRETAQRLRFLVREVGADGDTGSLAAEGLAALAEGDLAGAIDRARAMLDALEKALGSRRDQTVVLVGHAHLDMNWLWTEGETVQCAHDTFRQVMRFFDEFPQFHFSQSQASIYEMVERTDPELFEVVARKIREGRWELLGGAVDEGDTNLSSGEAIARTLLLGQSYFRSRFGKTAKVGWLPDNFGHVAQLPQILNLAGIRYFYAFRCQPTSGPYWWESPDGSRLLAFSTPTYNGEINPQIRLAPQQYNPKQGVSMAVYGVGDHGGGPTRRDITRALQYDTFRSFPKMRFGTAESFYRTAEKAGDAFPVHRGELQYEFEGCYTTIARVKRANRRGENLLYLAEVLASLAALEGGREYPAQILAKAWWKQAFNQFHDILCGSAIHEANDEALAQYQSVQAPVEEWVGLALRDLWERWGRRRPAKPRNGAGHPVLVFNPMPEQRRDVAEVEVFTPIPPASARIPHWGHFIPRPVDVRDVGQGPIASVRVEDDGGAEIPGQIVGGKLFPNGYRIRVQFLAEDVPPTGVRGYRVYPGEPGRANANLRTGDRWIETPRYRVEFDEKTGYVRRIRDRKANREIVKRGDLCNALNITWEAPHPMSGWDLGPATKVERIDDVQSARMAERGPVRAVYEVRRLWGRSEFLQRTIVYADSDRIDFELDVRWYEVGGPDHDSPTLRVGFPLRIEDGRFVCDTPFAALERPRTGQEVPAQKWVDLSGGGYGVSLLSDSKYGYRCTDDVVEMTLLRASYEPDICPDLGPHSIRYAIRPHAGTWKRDADRAGMAFNLPLVGREAPTGFDIAAPKKGLELEPANVFLSAWKRAEDGRGWIVRFHEGRGKETDAVLRFPAAVKSAERVNIIEDPLKDAPAARVRGRTVRVKVRPHEIVSLRIRFA